MNKLKAALVVGIFFLFWPLLPPIAMISYGLYQRRLRKAADRFQCAGCGTLLGRESIELRDAEWGRRMREMSKNHPGVRFRIVRTLDAMCASCGKRYRFIEKTGVFVGSSDE